MIIIIETAAKKNSLHFFEFVKPVLDILDEAGMEATVRHYKDLTKEDIEDATKFIICGNGLQDHQFLKDSRKFGWLKTTHKPVLGICAGMQMIGKVHGGKVKENTRIEVSRIQFLDPDPLLGKMSKFDVYELHNYMVTLPPDFLELAETSIPVAFKKMDAPIYGVLFHPEVMNKELVKAFAQL